MFAVSRSASCCGSSPEGWRRASRSRAICSPAPRFLALFLGFGKRSHELAGARGQQKAARGARGLYPACARARALAITGAASLATYVAYTIDPDTRQMFHSNWLWLTAPNPLFGVLRFLFLVRTRPKAESPTQEMLRDAPVHAEPGDLGHRGGGDRLQPAAQRRPLTRHRHRSLVPACAGGLSILGAARLGDKGENGSRAPRSGLPFGLS